MFKKILILRLSAIGDTIHTLPLLNALKKKYPGCKTGWIVEDKAALFIQNHPCVDKCYVIPKKKWKNSKNKLKNIKEFFEIIREINNEHYDIVIDTQQLFKSAIFLPFLNIKRKITLTGGREFSYLFSNEFIKESHALFDTGYHVVKRNMEFAKYLGADPENIEFKLAQPDKETIDSVDKKLTGLTPDKKVIVISPATTWKNKHWDEKCWIQVLEFLKNRANIIFTGTKQDMQLIERISEGLPNKIILAGKTNLTELAEIFRRADVVISPDSGSAHIAWAVEKPFVITVFTATSALRNAPFGRNCASFYPEIDCYPCMKRKCRRKKEKNICCTAVSPEKIVNILKNILHYD